MSTKGDTSSGTNGGTKTTMSGSSSSSNAVTTTTTTTASSSSIVLPDNRFELELEFVQALASPAYLHYLATTTNENGESLLSDVDFRNFLRYLQTTWSQPEYCKFITYPHSLYFLDLLITSESFCTELMNVQFRDFCHQQQFYAWQNRFATLYGVGEEETTTTKNNNNSSPTDDQGGENNIPTST